MHSNSVRSVVAADGVAAAVVVVGTFAHNGMVIHSVAAGAADVVVATADVAVAAWRDAAVGMDDGDDEEDRESNGMDGAAGVDVAAAWDVACMWRWWALEDCSGR